MIKLDLSKHCIETETRRCYNRAVAGYFKAAADRKRLEAEIDLLQRALQGLDFAALRGAHPALAGNSTAEVLLGENDCGELTVLVDGETVI
jgi:hypothetical protein